MFNKAKLFKLNILKAFHDDETRTLQKDVLKSIIIDELTDEEAETMYHLQAEKRKREALKELGLPEDTDLKALGGSTAGQKGEVETEKGEVDGDEKVEVETEKVEVEETEDSEGSQDDPVSEDDETPVDEEDDEEITEEDVEEIAEEVAQEVESDANEKTEPVE